MFSSRNSCFTIEINCRCYCHSFELTCAKYSGHAPADGPFWNGISLKRITNLTRIKCVWNVWAFFSVLHPSVGENKRKCLRSLHLLDQRQCLLSLSNIIVANDAKTKKTDFTRCSWPLMARTFRTNSSWKIKENTKMVVEWSSIVLDSIVDTVLNAYLLLNEHSQHAMDTNVSNSVCTHKIFSKY